MIVKCPECKRQISSQMSVCPHCGHEQGELDDEQLLELQRRRLRDRIYHLKMTSYGVITLFLAAFGWYWWQTAGFMQRPATGPIVLLAVGTIGYVLIRVMLFTSKRRMKELSHPSQR